MVKISAPQIHHLLDAEMKEFILASPAMHSVLSQAVEVAKYDASVMITGESGTGKEMLAKIIHMQSPRMEKPFVPVNCGVLSGMIFEDKLFGHEKGAFTGAISQKLGCFELAHQGTLLLDEISELPLENQVDFLRVLEDFSFTRIGGTEVLTSDVRIVSATNKDLPAMISEGRFRRDLFFRLRVVPLHLPPLRERPDALPELVHHFLDQFSTKYKKLRPEVSRDFLDILRRYRWPGNVRELKNLTERVLIMCKNAVITPADLPEDFMAHLDETEPGLDLAEVRKNAESSAICRALNRTGGDREKAAELLNISPRTLRHKMQSYGLKIDTRGRRIDPLEVADDI